MHRKNHWNSLDGDNKEIMFVENVAKYLVYDHIIKSLNLAWTRIQMYAVI
jgi:hypothetical protein